LQPQDFVFALSKALGILSSLFSSLKAWQTSKLAFAFRFFLISTMNFEKATSYFSTSNPAFSQAYVLRVRPLFFQ
jgi:glycerol-3-phosphate responsive antiterminator